MRTITTLIVLTICTIQYAYGQRTYSDSFNPDGSPKINLTKEEVEQTRAMFMKNLEMIQKAQNIKLPQTTPVGNTVIIVPVYKPVPVKQTKTVISTLQVSPQGSNIPIYNATVKTVIKR